MSEQWTDGTTFMRFGLSSRREFMKRAVLMGTAVPSLGALLAACGGDDDDDTPVASPTPEPAAADPTATAEPEDEETSESEPTASEATATSPVEEPTATAEHDEPEPTATTEQTSDGPPQGGTMIVMGHHEVASLSPDDAGPFVHWAVVANIHNSMLELDPWFSLQPILAESFDVSDDGLEYSFSLREGVLFHDGEEFTSEDVKYTFDYYRDPDNGTVTAQNFVGIDEVEAPDDYTVLVHMEEPNAAFLSRAGQAMIVPAHYHSEVGEDAYKAAAIGTGAFKVKEWRAADFTELEAFDDHFRGRPNIDIFRMDVVPEPSVRAIALDTGEADSSVWSLLAEDNVRFVDNPDYTTFITSALHTNHFPINNEKPYFAEKEVRQAHMYAMDREELINGIWLGQAVLATSNLSPALDFYYEQDVKQYPYDPDMAMQLLDEAGWVMGDDGVRVKDGQRLSWTCTMITGDVARRALVEVCQQYFAAVGIEMNIEEAPLATIREGFLQGTIDASHYNSTYGGGSGEPDASTVLKTGERGNQSRFSNDRVDELCDLGLEETDPERRREIYSEIQKIVAEEVPWLYIMHWDWYNIFSNRIQGLPEDAFTGTEIYRLAHTFWIEED